MGDRHRGVTVGLDELSPLDRARAAAYRLTVIQPQVDRLRITYREAIREAHEAGCSQREIARQVGVSAQTVNKIISAHRG